MTGFGVRGRFATTAGSSRRFSARAALPRIRLFIRSSVVKVDKDLDLKLLGPLGCGIQTGAGAVINYLKARPGKPIAVFGTGSVGLSALLAARAVGCAPIIAVDRMNARLELAKKFGATHSINNEKSRDLKRDIIHLSGGLKYALDTTGDTHLMELAVTLSAAGRQRLRRGRERNPRGWTARRLL